MKNLFTNICILLVLAIGFSACTEEISEEIQNEENLSSSSTSSGSSDETLTMSVTSETSSEYSHFLHEKSSDDEGCELNIENADDIEASDYSYTDADLNTDCILDAGEFDLYYQGAELKINVDAGLCENIQYRPFKFFQYQPGNSKKVLYKVECDSICGSSDNSVIESICEDSETLYDDLGTLTGFNPAVSGSTTSDLPFTNSVEADSAGDLCKFNHSLSNSDSPNCDEGDITIKTYTLTGTEEDSGADGNGCSVSSTDGTTDRETSADCVAQGSWTPISCQISDIAFTATPEATCNASTTWSPGYCNKNGLLLDDDLISQSECESTTNVWVEGFCLVGGVQNSDQTSADCTTSGGSWNTFGTCADAQYTYEDDCEGPGGSVWTPNKSRSEDSSIKGGYCSILPEDLINEVDCEFAGTWSNASCSDSEIENEATCTVARTWNSTDSQCYTTNEVTSTECASYDMTVDASTPVYAAASCSIATRTDQSSCETAGEWTDPNTCGDSTGAADISFVTDSDEDSITDCGGSHTSCFAGPISDLAETRDQWIKYQVTEGESYSKTHSIPSPHSEGYLSNMSIANYSRVCSEIGTTKDSAYWLGGPSFETAEIEEHNIDNPYSVVTIDEYQILAESAIKGSFNYYGAGSDYGESLVVSSSSTTPFYSFRCLDHAGDVKAQIRVFIREWDRSFIDETQTAFDFTAVSDLWLADNSRYMDSYNATNAPTDEWNDVYDWDDFWKDQTTSDEIFTNNQCDALEDDPNNDYSCSDGVSTDEATCLGAGEDWNYVQNSSANFPGLAL